MFDKVAVLVCQTLPPNILMWVQATAQSFHEHTDSEHWLADWRQQKHSGLGCRRPDPFLGLECQSNSGFRTHVRSPFLLFVILCELLAMSSNCDLIVKPLPTTRLCRH